MVRLDRITIKGFKSIEKLEDFELGNINVLIGANGAGKTSFIEALRVLRTIVKGGLREYCAKKAYSGDLFFNGPQVTKTIVLGVVSGENHYQVELSLSADGSVRVSHEWLKDSSNGYESNDRVVAGESWLYSSLRFQTFLIDPIDARAGHVAEARLDWAVYHFNKTDDYQGMRQGSDIFQTHMLFSDGSNLASFLYGMRERHPSHYDLYVKTIRRIAPYIAKLDFIFDKSDTIKLAWFKSGSDFRFGARHLSDGTIRFMCLAAILCQPSPPSLVVIDEPELGLHPDAVSVFAGLVRTASARMQIILATQSPALVSEFEPREIITVDHVTGRTIFKRFDDESLKEWLTDYSLGELWQKGNLSGGIHHD